MRRQRRQPTRREWEKITCSRPVSVATRAGQAYYRCSKQVYPQVAGLED
jgi:hypothetical protein